MFWLSVILLVSSFPLIMRSIENLTDPAVHSEFLLGLRWLCVLAVSLGIFLLGLILIMTLVWP